MKKNILINTIVFLFMLLFLYTGLSKLIFYHDTYFAWEQSPLLQPVVGILVILIPALEIVTSIGLWIEATRKKAFYMTLFLMIGFTLYVVYMLLFFPPDHRPCNCGGIITQMNWQQHLLFNVLFTMLALLGLSLKKQHTSTTQTK
jgi:putative oxidoreductase